MNAAARLLDDNKDKILKAWTSVAQDRVLAASISNTLALRDHLPDLLENLILLLKEETHWLHETLKESHHYKEVETSSSEHGRHRASTQAYTIEQIIHEYILLHELVTELFHEHQLNSPAVLSMISFTFEHAMRQAALAFSSSLEELNEKLVATFVHDLRNPLANAQLATSLLENSMPDERNEKLLNLVKSSLQKALGLVNNLTELVTAQAGAGLMVYFRESDFQQPAESVYDDSRKIFAQEFCLNLPPEPVKGILDETAIRRMLESIVTNAVKYTESQGKISISLKEDDKDNIIYEIESPAWQFSLEQMQEIDLFFKEDLPEDDIKLSNYGVWGMNLSLVKAIAEAHKGTVSCKSSANTSTFIISLHKKPSKAGKVRAKVSSLSMHIS